MKLLLFSAIFFLLIYYCGNDFKNFASKSDYMAAIIEKHNRLNMLTGKRIIFVGGSNLAFGIDSAIIEKQFKTPVVNLGLHAGLGLEFILNEIKLNLKKEDAVFISIEYFLDIDGDYKLKKITSNYFVEAKNYFNYDPLKEIKIFFDDKKKNLKTNIKLFNIFSNTANKNEIEPSIYSKDFFNSHGDMVGHLKKDLVDNLKDRSKLTYKFYEGINILNKFYEFAEAKSVRVYFLFPNYPKSEYLKNSDAIEKYYKDLLKHLKIPIIACPNQFVFEDILFYDTIYHLNKEGIKIRTEKIIEILKTLEI